MSAETAPDLDLALRALADGNRRAILRVIRSAPQPVGAIAEEVGLSQQTTSHHLGVLRKAGSPSVPVTEPATCSPSIPTDSRRCAHTWTTSGPESWPI